MNVNINRLVLRSVLTAISLICVIFIFTQSMLPATTSSAESGRVVTFLNGILESIGITPFLSQNLVRTCAHFTEFLIIGIMFYFTVCSYTNQKIKINIISPIMCVSTAVIDEFIQLFPEGRSFQLSDIVVDSLGSACGIMIALFSLYIFASRKLTRK